MKSQHIIQDYEGWSGGGNQNSVKLTDTSALRKLITHMDRKIDQNKTRFAELAADHPGIVREDGGSVTRDWEQVRDQAQELMNDEHPLRQAMAREDSLQQKYDNLKKQVSGVREEIENKYQKDVDAYKEQRDKINAEGTRLTNERMKAIAEKDYTLAHELHVKIMENINERSQLTHPLFDLKGVEERQAPLEAKALETYQSLKYAKDQVREQVQTLSRTEASTLSADRW
jgi:predicted nucleotide-binding protein (sugar kinase/HSP70/actin superfamily)